MAVVAGDVLRVYVDGTVVGYATSTTINLSTELDQLAPTSVSGDAFNTVKPRRKSGTITTNALYGTSTNKDFKDLFTAWDGDSSVTIAFKYDSAGEWNIAGTAYITNLTANGSVSQDATLSVTFAFSGAITLTDIT